MPSVTRFYNVNIPRALLARVERVRVAKGMTKEGVVVAALAAFLKKNRIRKEAAK